MNATGKTMLNWSLRKNFLVIAYFCDHVSKEEKLDVIRNRIGSEDFKEALNLLEETSIIEYPMEYPAVSQRFPRGIPYPGTNYVMVSFVFFPAWIQAYMNRLKEVKALLTRLQVTTELVDDARKEVPKLDKKYKERLRMQCKELDSWQIQDKEVIVKLLNPSYKGEIKFSNSTRFWQSAT